MISRDFLSNRQLTSLIEHALTVTQITKKTEIPAMDK